MGGERWIVEVSETERERRWSEGSGVERGLTPPLVGRGTEDIE